MKRRIFTRQTNFKVEDRKPDSANGQPGMRSRSPGVWILAQGPSQSPDFLKSQSRSWSPAKKEDCFCIFMYLLQCRIIFVQLAWTYASTGNLNFVCAILCTVLEHMTEMRFK